ncbi:hypothetical protein NP233_g2040 [Leucocoprinus birnbaumii]|uniref:Uncharacterized protein n=1 Tax=Leucocoprinus birnbaumii TaxID=56174 RepID=A0AAD5YU70_9AGAR|nr:hypothetical protein NP233_g2040 [Leucocoprinus birnbaumii]
MLFNHDFDFNHDYAIVSQLSSRKQRTDESPFEHHYILAVVYPSAAQYYRRTGRALVVLERIDGTNNPLRPLYFSCHTPTDESHVCDPHEIVGLVLPHQIEDSKEISRIDFQVSASNGGGQRKCGNFYFYEFFILAKQAEVHFNFQKNSNAPEKVNGSRYADTYMQAVAAFVGKSGRQAGSGGNFRHGIKILQYNPNCTCDNTTAADPDVQEIVVGFEQRRRRFLNLVRFLCISDGLSNELNSVRLDVPTAQRLASSFESLRCREIR